MEKWTLLEKYDHLWLWKHRKAGYKECFDIGVNPNEIKPDFL